MELRTQSGFFSHINFITLHIVINTMGMFCPVYAFSCHIGNSQEFYTYDSTLTSGNFLSYGYGVNGQNKL